MAFRAAFEASDHDLLVIARGCIACQRRNELWLLALLKNVRFLVTNAALDMAMGAVIKASVPQPRGWNVRRHDVGHVCDGPIRHTALIVALLAFC